MDLTVWLNEDRIDRFSRTGGPSNRVNPGAVDSETT
jgi:hypothetical protein